VGRPCYNAPVSVFQYTAFGLAISSEIEFPELLQHTFAAPQVVIKYGSVSEHLADATARGITYDATHDEFLFRVANIARYLISNGTQITVEPLQDAQDAIRLLLLGPVICALLNQRGYIVLHGSAIETENGAVVFSGRSGAGKSTIAAGFSKRGYHILSDDSCALQKVTPTELVAVPSFPRLKLWRDSAKHIGLDPAGMKRVRPELEKYNYPIKPNFSLDPQPLRGIYALEASNQEEISFKPLKGLEKIGALARNIVGRRYLAAIGRQTDQFAAIAAVAERQRICSVVRPEKSFLLEELLDALEKDWSQS